MYICNLLLRLRDKLNRYVVYKFKQNVISDIVAPVTLALTRMKFGRIALRKLVRQYIIVRHIRMYNIAKQLLDDRVY